VGEKLSVFAVVLAAGRSERMGTQKLALRLGSKTVLQRVVQALSDARVESILVALGPSAAALADSIVTQADVLALDEQTPDMRCTLQLALDRLRRTRAMEESDGVLVVLGDQPTLKPSIVTQLAAARQIDPGAVVAPVHAGRRGHPVLFPWKVVCAVERLPAGQGLNALLRSPASRVREVAVDDPDVLLDLDDLSDWEKLSKRSWD